MVIPPTKEQQALLDLIHATKDPDKQEFYRKQFQKLRDNDPRVKRVREAGFGA